jgi:hypothetical protein
VAAVPFEDPRKTDMRGRCEIAIDSAGHELAQSLSTFPLPEGLKGVIKGDLQSLDGQDVKHIYYLRPIGNKPVPQWLVTMAAAARERDDIELFLVVEDVGVALEKSCESRGVGLLRLTEDDAFEMVVNPSDFEPEVIEQAVATRIKDTRRRMEQKLDLKKGSLEDDYSRVDEITSGMPRKTRDEYIESVEQALTRWEDWGLAISQKLDEAGSESNLALVEEAEKMIEQDVESD